VKILYNIGWAVDEIIIRVARKTDFLRRVHRAWVVRRECVKPSGDQSVTKMCTLASGGALVWDQPPVVTHR
jgi:hypothetical protein